MSASYRPLKADSIDHADEISRELHVVSAEEVCFAWPVRELAERGRGSRADHTPLRTVGREDQEGRHTFGVWHDPVSPPARGRSISLGSDCSWSVLDGQP